MTLAGRDVVLEPLLALYRKAQTLPSEAFAAFAFDWLRSRIHFDLGALITSFPDKPGYIDAEFSGYDDPSAVMASWGKVVHLDDLSPRLLAMPLAAQRQDFDAAEIAGNRYEPLRDHLARFKIFYSACLAVPGPNQSSATVVILSRSTPGNRFNDGDLSDLEKLGPHVTEALSISRGLTLVRHQQIGIGDLPVALVNRQGRIVYTTVAFSRLFWIDHVRPHTTQLDQTSLELLEQGQGWNLPGGLYRVFGVTDDTGWLLRIRPTSPLDRLSERERSVVQLYARGAGRKVIARELGMAPSTVKNHLTNSFAKLNLGGRAALLEMFPTNSDYANGQSSHPGRVAAPSGPGRM